MQTTFKLFPSVVGKLFVSFLLCFGLLLVSGCGSSEHPSALVGKWKGNRNGLPEFPDFELLKSGTAIMGGSEGTWRVEDGRLFIKSSRYIDLTGKYAISGSTLTLTNDESSTTKTFERKQE